MIKHYCQRLQIILNNFVICVLGLFCLNDAYAIPAKEKQDEKLNITLNQHQQLCVYSSDEKYHIISFFIQKKTLFRANDVGYATMPQIPNPNPFAGSGLKNCITNKEFSEKVEYNQPYHLALSFKNRDTLLLDSRKYTDFCLENKNQQIRLVGVKKQGNQFVCTDQDWQPYQPKKGFWSRLFGR